jgi:hypothetical protein
MGPSPAGFMTKTLLSLLVVATQLLSWNASPLYFCLGDDGSMCIDFGPDTCGCCLDKSEDACYGAHEPCPADHKHDTHVADHAADHGQSNPCGCDHVQISEPQIAVRHRAVDIDAHDVLAAAVLAVDASACHVAAADVQLTESAFRPAIPRPALAELSSVVLRC